MYLRGTPNLEVVHYNNMIHIYMLINTVIKSSEELSHYAMQYPIYSTTFHGKTSTCCSSPHTILKSTMLNSLRSFKLAPSNYSPTLMQTLVQTKEEREMLLVWKSLPFCREQNTSFLICS